MCVFVQLQSTGRKLIYFQLASKISQQLYILLFCFALCCFFKHWKHAGFVTEIPESNFSIQDRNNKKKSVCFLHYSLIYTHIGPCIADKTKPKPLNSAGELEWHCHTLLNWNSANQYTAGSLLNTAACCGHFLSFSVGHSGEPSLLMYSSLPLSLQSFHITFFT